MCTPSATTITMFSVDLVYSGLFQFMNVRPDDIEPLIWIECPRLLFPFSRQILAEITREGGYPPLLINPIDFTPLYWAELRDREAQWRSGELLARLSWRFAPERVGAKLRDKRGMRALFLGAEPRRQRRRPLRPRHEDRPAHCLARSRPLLPLHRTRAAARARLSAADKLPPGCARRPARRDRPRPLRAARSKP